MPPPEHAGRIARIGWFDRHSHFIERQRQAARPVEVTRGIDLETTREIIDPAGISAVPFWSRRQPCA
jgi:hypothetical protein